MVSLRGRTCEESSSRQSQKQKVTRASFRRRARVSGAPQIPSISLNSAGSLQRGRSYRRFLPRSGIPPPNFTLLLLSPLSFQRRRSIVSLGGLGNSASFSLYPKKPNCNNSGLQTSRGFQTTDFRAVAPLLRYKYLPLPHSAMRHAPLTGKHHRPSFCLFCST